MLERNIVVRATIKFNGKPPILGTCNPKTPVLIDLEIWRAWLLLGSDPTCQKPWKLAPQGPPAKGWNIIFKCFFSFFINFWWFLAQLWRTFLGVSPPFLRQTTVPVGINLSRGSRLQDQKFYYSPLKTWIFRPVFGGTENFRPKTLYNGEAHK